MLIAAHLFVNNNLSTCQREFWSLTIKGKLLLDIMIQMNQGLLLSIADQT